jgi:hypothetical protein
MHEAGIPVHRLRAEEIPFHASLAEVNRTFDAAAALPVINAAANNGSWWNQDAIEIDTFTLEGTNWTFHATK